MFLDEATITVQGGKGGDGIVAWRKEKYVPMGGPWGGNGGHGGSVIFEANNQTDTLTTFSEVKNFAAESGDGGGENRRAGKAGEDLILKVPPGTIITETGTGKFLADLAEEGQQVKIARGGRGGYGNAHFATSIRQAPDFAEKGEPGEAKKLHLELKLVAEVGIIGYPSVGKSTLISVISAAKPKIAEYPFTTLVPNLGVVTVHRPAGRSSRRSEGRSFIVCDIPGLIEGASEGKGLGIEFLRHIERCGVLVHLLDVNRDNLVEDYRKIRNELERYSPSLSQKRELVVMNKTDLVQNDSSLFTEELSKHGIEVFASISAVTHFGIKEFLNKLLPIVLDERQKRLVEWNERSVDIPILRPQLDDNRTDAFVIEKIEEDGRRVFRVRGKRIEQIAKMTNWENNSAVQRFRDIEGRTGLQKALERSGADDESPVFIGDVDVTGYW